MVIWPQKPIIGAIKGDAANEIKRSNSGYTCDPGSPKVSDIILKMYNHSNQERKSFGINGYNFVKQNRSINNQGYKFKNILT